MKTTFFISFLLFITCNAGKEGSKLKKKFHRSLSYVCDLAEQGELDASDVTDLCAEFDRSKSFLDATLHEKYSVFMDQTIVAKLLLSRAKKQ